MCNSLRNTNAAVEDEQMDRERERVRGGAVKSKIS